MSTRSMEERWFQDLARNLVSLVREPEDEAPFSAVAENLLEIDQSQEALQVTRAGLSRAPRSRALSLLEARILNETGDKQGAWNALGRLLEIEPQDRQGLWLKAQIGRQLGKKPEAIEAARALLHIVPDHEEAKALLAELAPQQREEKEPVAAEKGAGTRRTITTATMAEIYVKQGYLNKAVHVYRELLAADPESNRIQKRLQELEGQVGAPAPPEQQQPQAQQQSVVEPAQPPVQQESATISSEQKLLNVFESWLTAIRQRRSHVH